MKEGLLTKKLEDFCDIKGGFAFKSTNYVEDNGIRIIRIANVQNGYISDEAPQYYPYSSQSDLEGYLLKENDILISLTGNVGRVGLMPASLLPSYLNQRVLCLRTEKYPEVNARYLYYLLNTSDFKTDCIASSHGAAQLNLSPKFIQSYKIALPSLSEQKRIVSILNEAFVKIDALKANAEKKSQNAQVLFQRVLTTEFEAKADWNIKKLGELGECKNGINFAKNESGNIIHLLGVGDFGNKFSISNTDELSTISLNEMPSEDYLLQNEDVVFVRSNGNKQLVGRSLIVYPNTPTTFSGFCIRFRKNTDIIDVPYLVSFLKTEYIRKRLLGNGTNISNLNQKMLQELVVPFPPLDIQKRIVEKLHILSNKLERLVEISKQTISECDAFKQAILHQAFKGEL